MAVPAPRISAMKRSGIREIMDLANRRPDTIRLEVGEPDFATPAHVVEAACAAARGGYTHYTASRGLPEVREVIAAKLKAENGIAAAPDDILVTCGAVNALFETLAALVSPGEKILVPDPGWPNYEMMAATLSARVERYPLLPGNGFLPDLERLDRLAADPDVKVLVVNSPGNPTGAVFPRPVLERLVEIAQRHDLFLVSDECYEQIVFEGEHVSPATLADDGRVLSVFSMSKSYAMTGWRMGYVTGDSALIELIAKTQEPVIACATAVAQKAGQAALSGDQSYVREMVASYRSRRDMAVDLLRAGGALINEPRGAFYVLADISSCGMDSVAFARRLVTEKQVAVVPGSTFGPAGSAMVRLSLATDREHLRIGTQRLLEAREEWSR
ncbi:pyridoxal phosphate-dependent aminotransferase [Amycolatopsis jejuensis]|uniref:pyridoxal phosphate-dependent aminotransferase n=1 Tax=Amycolatopsis jejuensis TaxID=330084 RepID=UPI0005273C8D|nr:aminotransferase class I/II-fold pyridoxal phosphate-dependent enzyme [Amycolatopsis jejuensis]